MLQKIYTFFFCNKGFLPYNSQDILGCTLYSSVDIFGIPCSGMNELMWHLSLATQDSKDPEPRSSQEKDFALVGEFVDIASLGESLGGYVPIKGRATPIFEMSEAYKRLAQSEVIYTMLIGSW